MAVVVGIVVAVAVKGAGEQVVVAGESKVHIDRPVSCFVVGVDWDVEWCPFCGVGAVSVEVFTGCSANE